MRIPRATYRLQLTPTFGFREAREVLPYLHDLGISDIYASPVVQARSGSTHGYDGVDPSRVSADLGGAAELDRLLAAAGRLELGWLQDIVPNHMAYDGQNCLLMDVFEHGRRSAYRDFFDIEWPSSFETARERVLAPFLGRFYGEALEAGEIQLEYGPEGFGVHYYGLRFPLRLESYEGLLTRPLERLRERLGEEHPALMTYLALLYVLRTLGSLEDPTERAVQTRFAKHALWELYEGQEAIRAALDETVCSLNGTPGEAGSFSELDELLSAQVFRLSFWKVATQEIDYRRFFTVNELISLRAEREDVFDRTHNLLLTYVAERRITGLRVDHIDGLSDPGEYLARLRAASPDAYLVVEKILGFEEELPAGWPVQGTTGYEFLNWVNGLFVDSGAKPAFDRLYARFARDLLDSEELLYEKKILILLRHLAGDIDNLARLLKHLAGRFRYGADITLSGLRRALFEVMANFPLYRTYAGGALTRPEDRRTVAAAVQAARHRVPDLLHDLNFLERFLQLDFDENLGADDRAEWVRFVQRFQQFTGPLQAKAGEDTFLYVYHRLLSLNEVGGSPERFGIAPERFHRWAARRLSAWPHALNATSTHDTKRGEDARARLSVLSELPSEWAAAARLWRRLNAGKKRRIGRRAVPDGNDEYFLYQTLLGSWPFDEAEVPAFRERLRGYLVKAVREAKVHTAWLKPDAAYEEAFVRFADSVLDDQAFLAAFLPFQRRIAHHGVVNSLAQTLIKITAPGVPDFYQGRELWDLSLVDPDNRRPVDYGQRQTLLEEIRGAAEGASTALSSRLLAEPGDGGVKLFLIHRALAARQRRPEVFQTGEYLALRATGLRAEQAFAFARRSAEGWAVTLVPRLTARLLPAGTFPLGETAWGDTRVELPQEAPGRWRDALSGEEIEARGFLRVSEALRQFPATLLLDT
ncbi:MAG: malto-oligosyltrehalose synthase [Deltaproteobacteria bacterium]|nr:malto-oligosyltrehalose synthase [Deltaproteobacteria bacterium]